MKARLIALAIHRATGTTRRRMRTFTAVLVVFVLAAMWPIIAAVVADIAGGGQR